RDLGFRRRAGRGSLVACGGAALGCRAGGHSGPDVGAVVSGCQWDDAAGRRTADRQDAIPPADERRGARTAGTQREPVGAAAADVRALRPRSDRDHDERPGPDPRALHDVVRAAALLARTLMSHLRYVLLAALAAGFVAVAVVVAVVGRGGSAPPARSLGHGQLV